jgi:hypothetical protein
MPGRLQPGVELVAGVELSAVCPFLLDIDNPELVAVPGDDPLGQDARVLAALVVLVAGEDILVEGPSAMGTRAKAGPTAGSTSTDG